MTHGYQAKSKLFGFKSKLPETKIYNTNRGIYSYEKVVFNAIFLHIFHIFTYFYIIFYIYVKNIA